MFVRCTVYDLWFNLLCRFCVDWTLCHVVWASNQKMKEQSVSSRFTWRYSLSAQYKRTLVYLHPPTLSSDVIISYTHLNDDVIISSYPPTYYFFFLSLIYKAKIRQGLFLLKKKLHADLVHFSRKKNQSFELNWSVIFSKG